MRRYKAESIFDKGKTYWYVRDEKEGVICELPSGYLMHKMRCRNSSNTIKQIARSIQFYLNYLDEKDTPLESVFSMKRSGQEEHFVRYLAYLQQGRHTDRAALPSNATCNAYLKNVFGYLKYLDEEGIMEEHLKVLRNRTAMIRNRIGVSIWYSYSSFCGFLPEQKPVGRSIKKEEIEMLLSACTNCRDQLLLLLLMETGFRIGELLGVRYTEDVDTEKRALYVEYRGDNENGALAKNAEYRRAVISEETMNLLLFYLAEYHDLIRKGDYLFVTLTGKNAGRPLCVDTVYAVFDELEKKTGIAATPHMLRHYFANERRKAGWDILLISKALGHAKIETTENYLHIEDEELEAASDAYFEKSAAKPDISQLLRNVL